MLSLMLWKRNYSMRRTKIVCTIGPATNSEAQLEQLMRAGMNVARLNFSHGAQQDHALVIERIRAISTRLDFPIAILQDLQGPKIRVGSLKDGQLVKLVDGATLTITIRDIAGTPEIVSTLLHHRLTQKVALPARRAFRMTITSKASWMSAPAGGLMKPKAAKSMVMAERPIPTQIPCTATRMTRRPRRTARATRRISVESSTDILRVARAVRLGRRVMRVAVQGIWVGMGLSAITMLFAAFGFISPPAGALIQEAFDVIVILNALRAGRATF